MIRSYIIISELAAGVNKQTRVEIPKQAHERSRLQTVKRTPTVARRKRPPRANGDIPAKGRPPNQPLPLLRLGMMEIGTRYASHIYLRRVISQSDRALPTFVSQILS